MSNKVWKGPINSAMSLNGDVTGIARAVPQTEHALRTDANLSSRRNVMQTRIIAAALLFTGAAFAGHPVRAQNIAAVEQVMVGVSTQTKQLDTALASLGKVSKDLHGSDAERADEVAHAGHEFSGAVGEATPVGVILRHMKNPEDVRFTRTMLAISATKAVLVADSDIQIINRVLPQISNPEAAAQSIKVRDTIVMTRNLLGSFALTARSPARAQANNT
jgi:hypothetical protein